MAVRVLIAHSSRITRDIIRNHLECGGCQVVAENGTVAQTIDIFRTTRPDVIMLDIGLRGEKGGDALSGHDEYRRLQALCQIERLHRHIEAFLRIRRKKQDMAGIAMRRISA